MIGIVVPDAGPTLPIGDTPNAAAPSQVLSEKVVSKVNQHSRYVALMTTALEAERGVRIKREDASACRALRARLYAARRWFRSQGQTSLERLIITVEEGPPSFLVITKEAPFQLEEF